MREKKERRGYGENGETSRNIKEIEQTKNRERKDENKNRWKMAKKVKTKLQEQQKEKKVRNKQITRG